MVERDRRRVDDGGDALPLEPSSIRLGAGGIMLPNHAPLLVFDTLLRRSGDCGTCLVNRQGLYRANGKYHFRALLLVWGRPSTARALLVAVAPGLVPHKRKGRRVIAVAERARAPPRSPHSLCLANCGARPSSSAGIREPRHGVRGRASCAAPDQRRRPQ
jgi:hypothetical protein